MIKDIIKDYLCGLPVRKLYKKYDISFKILKSILIENNIQKRSSIIADSYNRKQKFNTVDCKICGLHFKSMVMHLLKIHNLTSKQYIENFNSPVQTDENHEKLSQSAIERYKNNPELKDKLREIGRRNITKVNAEGKGWRTPVGFWSDEHRRYMSELLKGRNVTWCDKIRESHWTKSEKAQEIIDRSIMSQKRYRCKRGWYVSTKTNVNECYHSSYELRRMKELDEDVTVATWTKRHKILIPYQYDYVKHNYVPDLLIEYIDGKRVLEEIKGFVLNQVKHDAKCSAAIVWCDSQNIQYVVNFMKK